MFRINECDENHWRKRVQMTVEKASRADGGLKERLLRIAGEYQRMGEYAKARQKRESGDAVCCPPASDYLV
jgi:hypothetical protein